jgi:UTP--glucose-1-phosphate uridylyltransferase
LAHVLTELQRAGIRQVLFIVSERKPQIQAAFGNNWSAEIEETGNSKGLSLRCDYVIQREQRGLGDAVLQAEEWTDGKPFVLALGDCLIEANQPEGSLCRLLAAFQDHKAGASVLTEVVAREKVSRYGIVAPEGPITEETQTEPFAAADIVEKPPVAEAPSRFAVAARYVLGPEIFEHLHRKQTDVRGEVNITDALRGLRREGRPLWVVPLQPGERRRDIGNYESFYAAFIEAALQDKEFGNAAREVAREWVSRSGENAVP